MAAVLYAIRKVEFNNDGGLTIEFLMAPDIKKNGLVMARMLTIPPTADYAEEFDAVCDALNTLLFDALDDVINTEPASAPFEDDEDDDE